MAQNKAHISTYSGIDLRSALGSGGILQKGTFSLGFDLSDKFIAGISSLSRNDNTLPDEEKVGRECYSFSEVENRAFYYAMTFARDLQKKVREMYDSQGTGPSLRIETDAVGNLYFKVKGVRENKQESFETHMVGSHLDSVKNGGKYDGVAGVAAGMQILERVMYHQIQGTLQNSFCLTIFRSEESSPNNETACLGSTIATGNISEEALENIVYKKENGKNLHLKDFLESSLRNYFQNKGKSTWRRKDIPSAGEPVLSLEWWEWFCQQHNITPENYNSGDWWNKILELQRNPKITRENTQSYHELHIEQGTLIAGVDAHLGIVSGGIGGAKRYKTMQTISVESKEVSGKDYEVYSFDIFGKSDHTGSTPNNLTLESAEYRKDAHIAANLFLRVFLEKDFGEIISSEAQNDEGYTKIPFHQRMSLAIKKDKKTAFNQFLRDQSKLLKEKNGIITQEGEYRNSQGQISIIGRDSAKQMITSLLGVSDVVSSEFVRQKQANPREKKYGTTRATLTNVKLNTEGLQFQLDIREIDSNDVQSLLDGVSEALTNIILDGIDGLQKVSEKSHEKVDETLRNTAAEVAKILGLRTIFLPSIPGHDADRISSAGVPVSMIFVRQEDGISHNPAEKMIRQDYNRACEVFMKTVLAKLV